MLLERFGVVSAHRERERNEIPSGNRFRRSFVDDAKRQQRAFWMTAGQVPIAATASTVTSSEALAGAGQQSSPDHKLDQWGCGGVYRHERSDSRRGFAPPQLSAT